MAEVCAVGGGSLQLKQTPIWSQSACRTGRSEGVIHICARKKFMYVEGRDVSETKSRCRRWFGALNFRQASQATLDDICNNDVSNIP